MFDPHKLLHWTECRMPTEECLKKNYCFVLKHWFFVVLQIRYVFMAKWAFLWLYCSCSREYVYTFRPNWSSLYTNPLNFDCLVEEWWWWLEKLKWLVPHKFHTTTDSLRSSILGLQCILHLMPNMHSFRHYFCTHLHGSANGQNYIGIVLFSRVQIVLMISLHHAHVIKVDVGRRKFFSQSKLNKTKPRGQF